MVHIFQHVRNTAIELLVESTRAVGEETHFVEASNSGQNHAVLEFLHIVSDLLNNAGIYRTVILFLSDLLLVL